MADIEVHETAYLAPDGSLLRPLPESATAEARIGWYRDMVLTRTFDAKAIALQRTGRLGTFASSLGQEAVAVGVGRAMNADDVLVPSFREHGAQIVRGVTLEELFAFWGGDERGSDFAGPRQDFPVGITVGGHAPHAAGVALAFRLRREARASVCVYGDGATSKGDVYEAMNLAGVWHLPVVFVVNNNQWAISTPRREQTAARRLADKAAGTGFEGEQVDGNDVIAVHTVVAEAVLRARRGEGAHLIECLTYRLGDHTTSDDASRYRDDAEVSRWWQKDPVARLRTHLVAEGLWNRSAEEGLLKECGERVEAAAATYLARQPASPEAIFDFLYATLPEPLAAQRAALLARVGARDG